MKNMGKQSVRFKEKKNKHSFKACLNMKFHNVLYYNEITIKRGWEMLMTAAS